LNNEKIVLNQNYTKIVLIFFYEFKEFKGPQPVSRLMGAATGYSDFVICEGIFRGSMEEFIGTFSAFLEV